MPQCEVTAAGFICIYPLFTSCVSLGGPGPMHSFSEWEKLLQTRYTTQSVVCAMMWQLASIHGSPRLCPYLLAICWHHPPAKQTASHQQRAHPDSYFPAGIILARIYVEFSIIELPNPLKSVRYCKLPERQTSRVRDPFKFIFTPKPALNISPSPGLLLQWIWHYSVIFLAINSLALEPKCLQGRRIIQVLHAIQMFSSTVPH